MLAKQCEAVAVTSNLSSLAAKIDPWVIRKCQTNSRQKLSLINNYKQFQVFKIF